MIDLRYLTGNIVSERVMTKNVTRELILYTFIGVIIIGLLSLQEPRPLEYFIPITYITVCMALIFYIVEIKEKYIGNYPFLTVLLLIFSAIFLPIVIPIYFNPDHWLHKHLFM